MRCVAKMVPVSSLSGQHPCARPQMCDLPLLALQVKNAVACVAARQGAGVLEVTLSLAAVQGGDEAIMAAWDDALAAAGGCPCAAAGCSACACVDPVRVGVSLEPGAALGTGARAPPCHAQA